MNRFPRRALWRYNDSILLSPSSFVLSHKRISTAFESSYIQTRSFFKWVVFAASVKIIFNGLAFQRTRQLLNARYRTIIQTAYGDVQYHVSHPVSSSSKDDQKLKSYNSDSSCPENSEKKILFFHDCPGSCDQYESIQNATAFELPYPVISVARPGTLGTALLQRRDLDDITEINKIVVEKEACESPLHLVGFGTGGLSALHFAHKYPLKTASLTLLSARTRYAQQQKECHRGAGVRSKRNVIEVLEWHRLHHALYDSGLMALGVREERTLQRLFLLYIGNGDQKEIASSLANAYLSGRTRGGRKCRLKVPSLEFTSSLSRSFGSTNFSNMVKGVVNDYCNVCAVDVDINPVVKSRQTKQLASALKKGIQISGGAVSTVSEISEQLDREFEIHERTAEGPSREKSQEDKNRLSRLVATDNQDFLKEIRCPTLIIHTPTDTDAIFDVHARHAAAHIPHAKLEIFADSLHNLFFDRTLELEKKIIDFLEVN